MVDFLVIAEFDQTKDLSELKGASIASKAAYMDSAWEQFKLRSSWRPNRLAFRRLRPMESYMLVFDQHASAIRFGILLKSGVLAADKFPDSTSERSIKMERPLSDWISDLHQAKKIPVILSYWADPLDCKGDDDVTKVSYEEIGGSRN